VTAYFGHLSGIITKKNKPQMNADKDIFSMRNLCSNYPMKTILRSCSHLHLSAFICG